MHSHYILCHNALQLSLYTLNRLRCFLPISFCCSFISSFRSTQPAFLYWQIFSKSKVSQKLCKWAWSLLLLGNYSCCMSFHNFLCIILVSRQLDKGYFFLFAGYLCGGEMGKYFFDSPHYRGQRHTWQRTSPLLQRNLKTMHFVSCGPRCASCDGSFGHSSFFYLSSSRFYLLALLNKMHV